MRNIVLLFLVLFLSCNVASAEVNALYDQVWKLVNSKYVDRSNNKQNWERWRYKYDNVIKTPEDSYLAIETMLASLNDPYTKFLDPKAFEEETSSIKGSLKGIGVQIGISDGIIHKQYMDENEVYHTILHEIGHAVGRGEPQETSCAGDIHDVHILLEPVLLCQLLELGDFVVFQYLLRVDDKVA